MCLLELLNDPSKMPTLARRLALLIFQYNFISKQKIWLFWHNELDVGLVEEHEQVLTVDVLVLGSAQVFFCVRGL